MTSEVTRRAQELTDRRTEIIEIVSDSMRDLDHNGLGRCYGGAPTPVVGAAVADLLLPRFGALLDRLTATAELCRTAIDRERRLGSPDGYNESILRGEANTARRILALVDPVDAVVGTDTDTPKEQS